MKPAPWSVRSLAFLSLLFAATAMAGTTGPSEKSATRAAQAMGTWLNLELTASSSDAAARESERALRVIEEVEARLSTWRAGTELSAINALTPGGSLAISPATARALELAHECREWTGGAFDPGLGALIQAWGIRNEGFRAPQPEARARAREASGKPGFRLAMGQGSPRIERIREGYLYEEGGFAKGLALDQALRALDPATGHRGLLDFGGQLAWISRSGLELRIAHPVHRAEAVLRLSAPESGSLSTSGASERGSHILDPRTGEPARDFGSVTVLAEGRDAAFWADCLSTALYVKGPARGLAWLRETAPGPRKVEAVYIEKTPEGLQATASCGLRKKLSPAGKALIRLRWDCGK